MTHKSHLGILLGSISAIALCLGVAVINNNANPIDYAKADPTNYTVNLNSTVFEMSTLTTSYQTEVTQNLGQDKPIFNYFLAKKDNSSNLVLAPSGKLYNYGSGATYKGRITNIEKMTITYSGGALYVQEGLGGGATQYDTKAAVTSDVEYVFKTSPNHIMISNSRAETIITNIAITYSCEEAGFIVDRLGEKYNGKSAEGDTYVLTRDGNNVSVAGQNGTIALDGNGNFTITLASGAIVYTGKVTSDYKTLNFTGKSGAGADAAPTIAEMNRIYVLDDFESYTQNGNAYTSNPSHSKAQNQIFVTSSTASDLRAAYYSDYGGGSNNTWITNSTFQIPTSTDYLNKTNAVKHGGNQSALFKASTGGWMRHWTREVFDQNQHYNFGSGNRLSFWAHGAYKNTTCTTDGTDKVELRVNVYYQNFAIDDSNRNSSTYGTGVQTININAGTDWTEYIVSLDSSKKVYGINIMLNNSGLTANCYVPIDDISIYTLPVYEPTKKYQETATQITKSYHGSVNILSNNFTVKIGLGANDYIYAYAGVDMQPTSYSINGNQITIVTTGSYSNQTFGTWTGTLSNNNSTITIPKANITGTIKSYINTSTIVLNADTTLVDGTEGTLSNIENKILRQYYYSGSWTTDSSNANRLSIVNDYYIQGNSSIRVRPYASANIRVIMNPSLAESLGQIDSVAFWFYAPAGVSYTINVFSYKDATPSSTSGRNKQIVDKTYDGNNPEEAGWHYFNLGLDTANSFGRNFAIFVKSTSSQTILDYITYF